jgi:cytidylate kinase
MTVYLLGHLIVVTGILSAGKTTVSREIARRSSYLHFDGDGFARAHPPTPLDQLPTNFPAYTSRILERMLKEIEDRLESNDVVLDMILPGRYVERVHERFGDRAMLTLLTVDPAEQQRRETGRPGAATQRRKSAASRTDLSGRDSLYDLIVDTTRSSAGNCAGQILSKARDRWGE